MVPDDTPFILVPEQDTGIFDFLEASYAPMLDDMTPSAIQLINYIDEEASGGVQLDAVLFYPDMANDWQPIWISKAPSGLFEQLTSKYQKRFEQNHYTFKGFTIEKLFLDDRILFVITAGDYFIFSESSLGIENMIRTISGEKDAIDLESNQTNPGSLVANTGSLDKWVEQVAQVAYRPHLHNLFEGGNPVTFRMDSTDSDTESWRMSGILPLDEDRSVLLSSISSEKNEFTLDRYIPMNAAAFSIHRLQPRTVPQNDDSPQTEADEYIDQNLSIWQNIAAELDSEFAFATFAESGAESTSEFLYLRKIENTGNIRSELNNLVSEDLAIRDGDTYSIQSRWLAKLFGSELNPMTDFYITLYDEYVALASRKGLVESIGSDASRRRVMYYDDDFMEIKESLSESLSSIFFMNAREFGTYIQPWLYPQNYLSTLFAPLDQLVITTELEDNNQLAVQIRSYERESIDQPYRERWIFPLDGAEITGPSILADITGSSRDEIVFSTDRGNVFALAADGTTVLEASTDGDTPVGPPVAYDWYGNDQNVILQAAGNKIYAWNNDGSMLPNFPITLDEDITTPLKVEDITRNGVAELIVGTNDRKVHILDSRGRPINGWPQSTNATVNDAPFVGTYDGQRSLFVFSENTLHAWAINGQRRSGFPVFLPTQMHGAPAKFKDHIVGAGYDGNLYSIGTDSLFTDSLSVTHASDSLFVQSVQASNTSLNATPSSHDIMLRVDGELVRDEFVLVQSSNGSLFMYDDTGNLVLTQTMGQPSSDSFAPVISDIDRDQRLDLIALASFGRIYAWDVLSGLRILDLPTTGMSYPIILDVTGDGYMEIIAQTREGLRSWTILEVQREEESD